MMISVSNTPLERLSQQLKTVGIFQQTCLPQQMADGIKKAVNTLIFQCIHHYGNSMKF